MTESLDGPALDQRLAFPIACAGPLAQLYGLSLGRPAAAKSLSRGSP
jgi:hypothetical protein